MKQQDIDFLFGVIFIAPFCLLLSEMLFLSAHCAGIQANTNPFDLVASAKGFFCYGYPQFLQHSAYYDLFFLRGAFVKGAEHWTSALILSLVPLFVFAFTRKARFAFWTGIFFPLQHEIYWLIPAWAFKNPVGTLDDSIYYSIVCFFVSLFVIRRYKALYWRKEFLLVLGSYFSVLFAWAVTDNFHVTVGGALGVPILTPYYLNFLTNFFEVFSWLELGIAFIIYIYIFRKITLNFPE